MNTEQRVRLGLVGGGVAWVCPSDVRTVFTSPLEDGVTLVRVVVRDTCDGLRVTMSADEVQSILTGEVVQ